MLIALGLYIVAENKALNCRSIHMFIYTLIAVFIDDPRYILFYVILVLFKQYSSVMFCCV